MLTTQNGHTCEHPGQDWTRAHCMSAPSRSHLHLLTPAEDRHSLLNGLVGGNTFNSTSERQMLPRNLSMRVQRGVVAGEGQWAMGPPDRTLKMMHSRWKDPQRKWDKSGWNLVRTLGHTERAGKSCCINYSINGRQGSGADSSLHWVRLWESESRVTTQFLINNTHISVSKLSTCACLCNIK